MHFNEAPFNQPGSAKEAGKQISSVFLYLKDENVFLEDFEQSPLQFIYCWIKCE